MCITLADIGMSLVFVLAGIGGIATLMFIGYLLTPPDAD